MWWELLKNPPDYLQSAIGAAVIVMIVVVGILRFGGLDRFLNRLAERKDSATFLKELAELKAELKKDFDDQIANEKKEFAKQIQSIIQNAALQQNEIQTRLDNALERNTKLQTDLDEASKTIRNLNTRIEDVENDQKTLQQKLDEKTIAEQRLIEDNQEKDALIHLYRETLSQAQATIEKQAIREETMMDMMRAFGAKYTELQEGTPTPQASPKVCKRKDDLAGL